jgi:hypothetical protein
MYYSCHMNTRACPNCGKEFPEAFKLQIEKEYKLQLENAKQENLDEAVKIAKKQFEEKEKKYEVQIQQRDQKLDELRNKELKLIQEKTELEQQKKEMQLQVARQLEEKSKELIESTYRRAAGEHAKTEHAFKLRELEKDKTIADLKKSVEEANRKAQSGGSQQLQGDVFEVEVEDMLKKIFPQDVIQEIAKGVNGSDIRHIIKSPLGLNCGTILWECKRAKNWQQSWIGKLKTDLRNEKADIPVIVSTILPKEMKTSIDVVEGVYLCDFSYATFLALTLRERIIAVARQKAISANKESKAERLYNAVTSNPFKQHLKFLFETYKRMREQTEKERKVFDKLWKERDMQIDQLTKSTVSIYTTMAAELGSSMPQLEDFDLDMLASGSEGKT